MIKLQPKHVKITEKNDFNILDYFTIILVKMHFFLYQVSKENKIKSKTYEMVKSEN